MTQAWHGPSFQKVRTKRNGYPQVLTERNIEILRLLSDGLQNKGDRPHAPSPKTPWKPCVTCTPSEVCRAKPADCKARSLQRRIRSAWNSDPNACKFGPELLRFWGN